MKRDIHPDYVVTQVTCTCGSTFTTRSTAKNGQIHADVCSNCHPFYTGKQKILDTGGRVARFERRFGKQRQVDQLAIQLPGRLAARHTHAESADQRGSRTMINQRIQSAGRTRWPGRGVWPGDRSPGRRRAAVTGDSGLARG